MQATQVESAIRKVIGQIQVNSGLDCPELKGSTVPAVDVPDFDSKVWIAATTLLTAETGIEIPSSENIFVDKDTKAELNISQIASLVCKIASSGNSPEKVA